MPFLLNWKYISESLIFWCSDFRNVIQDITRNSYQIDEGSADCVSYHFPLLMDWKESWIPRCFQTTLLRIVVDDYVVYRWCKFQVIIDIFEFFIIFYVAYTLAWKHMASAPMFPNFISITLGINFYSLKFCKKSVSKEILSSTRGFF